jgi:hypothetical protein
MDETDSNVPAVPSDGETGGSDRPRGRRVAARDGASSPLAAGERGDELLGAGPGGFDEFGLKVKFRGVTYELTVNPPVVDGNGWSFGVSDTVSGKDPTTLASFLLVSSQSWSAVANAPQVKDLFGINIRQAALNIGAGPIATFTPTQVTVGGKITLIAKDFAGTVPKVTVFNNADSKKKHEFTPVAKEGVRETYEVTLTDVPVGAYSIHVTENKQDGLTVPAGTDVSPYHELIVKAS